MLSCIGSFDIDQPVKRRFSILFERSLISFCFLKDQQRASIDLPIDATLISTRISIIDRCVRQDKEANSMFSSIRYYLRTVLNALFLIILETIAAQRRDYVPFFKSTKFPENGARAKERDHVEEVHDSK